MSKFQEDHERIAGGVVESYRKIEKNVIDGCKKLEDIVVGGFDQVSDRFVDTFLTRKGESVEEAKARMNRAWMEIEKKNTEEK